jgi:hypothetical protein
LDAGVGFCDGAGGGGGGVGEEMEEDSRGEVWGVWV